MTRTAATRSPVTMPKERYTSEGFHALEHERIWMRVWQMACVEADVTQPGDFAEYSVGDQSVLVVRGADRRLRAFHNVCQHRGNRLRSGTGHVDGVIRCGYHCWAYGLDGALRDVPDREQFGDLDEAACGLSPVHVDTWGGFVF